MLKNNLKVKIQHSDFIITVSSTKQLSQRKIMEQSLWKVANSEVDYSEQLVCRETVLGPFWGRAESI